MKDVTKGSKKSKRNVKEHVIKECQYCGQPGVKCSMLQALFCSNKLEPKEASMVVNARELVTCPHCKIETTNPCSWMGSLSCVNNKFVAINFDFSCK